MAISSGSVSIYLLPGMKAKITVPDFWRGVGERKLLQRSGAYKNVELTNGFFVEDDTVGDIEVVDGEPAVIYNHKKYAPNRIIYFAKTGEIGQVHVVAVPIHDHSSVVTGGPAYGTYFTDDETLGEE